MYSLKQKAEESLVIINGKEEKLVLEYPCDWDYKVMCHTEINIEEIIVDVVKNRDFTHKKGNISKTGKYQSYNVTLLVHSDDDRRALFDFFKSHPNVKMVL